MIKLHRVLLTLGVCLLAVLAYLGLSYLNRPPTSAQVEAAVLARFRETYELPKEEKTMIATIVELAPLQKESAFYARASTGDRLIVTSSLAFLFSEKSGKILNVAPVAQSGSKK